MKRTKARLKQVMSIGVVGSIFVPYGAMASGMGGVKPNTEIVEDLHNEEDELTQDESVENKTEEENKVEEEKETEVEDETEDTEAEVNEDEKETEKDDDEIDKEEEEDEEEEDEKETEEEDDEVEEEEKKITEFKIVRDVESLKVEEEDGFVKVSDIKDAEREAGLKIKLSINEGEDSIVVDMYADGEDDEQLEGITYEDFATVESVLVHKESGEVFEGDKIKADEVEEYKLVQKLFLKSELIDSNEIEVFVETKDKELEEDEVKVEVISHGIFKLVDADKGAYEVSESDLKEKGLTLEDLKGEDIFEKIDIDGESIDLSELTIVVDGDVLTISHEDLTSDITVSLVKAEEETEEEDKDKEEETEKDQDKEKEDEEKEEEEEELKMVLKVSDDIIWDLGKPIDINQLRTYIIEASINGEDVAKDVEITHDADVSKPGEYEVVYTLKGPESEVITKKVRLVIDNDVEFKVPEMITIEKTDKPFKPDLTNVIAKKGEKSYVNELHIDYSQVDASTPGEYVMTYTLNIGEYSATQKTVVKVVDVEFIVPEQIILIKGEDFTPTLDGITAKINGVDVSDEITFKHNIDGSKVGEYELKYMLNNEGEIIERTTKVLVVDNILLEVPETAKIKQGEDFDPIAFVEKALIGDIDAIDKVSAEHEVDTDKPGVYDVVYSLDLGNGNVYEKTMKLTVEGPEGEGTTKPDGEDFEDKEDEDDNIEEIQGDEDDLEYEYVDVVEGGDGEGVVNEVVQTGEASAGYELLRTGLMSAPILGLTFGSYKKDRKRK